jgi:transforming growth factor-beta-induced protein
MNILFGQRKALLTTLTSAALLISGTALAKGKPDDTPFAPGKPGEGTIVDIAVAVTADPDVDGFGALLGAVGCFGDLTLEPGDNPIVDLLSGDEKFTLFAPTDTAFVNLLTRLEVVDPCVELIEDPSDPLSSTLFTVLAYHVVDGRRFSNSVFNANEAKMIETLAGVNITSYTDTDGTPLLTDVDGQTVGIVAPLFNLNASNGVIHVVDTVLLPIEIPEDDD